ncbi:MAG: zinc ribbon domain-containing protein [Treponema sp.]|jgi:putative FmdB family regulatory protein|nr:zinc ribbon domain-containing protein [Treponema sp.]
MPTYEYECKSCGHSFDVFQSMSETPIKTCPQCGKEVRRLINGGSGIIFKGSGFYVTDRKGAGAAKVSDGKQAPAGSACCGCAKAESGSCPKTKAAG